MAPWAEKNSTASSTLICSTSPMDLPFQGTASVSRLKRWPPQASHITFTSGRKLISILRMPWPSHSAQRPPAVLKLSPQRTAFGQERTVAP